MKKAFLPIVMITMLAVTACAPTGETPQETPLISTPSAVATQPTDLALTPTRIPESTRVLQTEHTLPPVTGEPAIHEGRLVVEDWKGVHFVDLAEPDRPRLHAPHPLAGSYGDVSVQGGYVHASSSLSSDSLLVVDSREPAEPVLHGPFPFSFAWGAVFGSALSGIGTLIDVS